MISISIFSPASKANLHWPLPCLVPELGRGWMSLPDKRSLPEPFAEQVSHTLRHHDIDAAQQTGGTNGSPILTYLTNSVSSSYSAFRADFSNASLAFAIALLPQGMAVRLNPSFP